MSEIKRVLSGVKPSGRPHIGNYFGAMKQFVDMQKKYDEVFIFIADYHALNTIQNKEEMHQNIIDLITDYIAIGLDPNKVVLYQQSKISEHTELAWIFDTITTMPYLERAHAYKDARSKNKEINVGTFNYPMLMSADILLYSPDIVPVGKDQKQHIEFARDTAQKFNRIFGDTFKLPEAGILEEVSTVPGLDGQKMSKSYKNTIPLFAEEDEIRKLVNRIVTNSDGSRPDNLINIHKLFKQDDYVEELYKKYGNQFGTLKRILADDIDGFVKPMRERRVEIAGDFAFLKSVLENGSNRARKIAQEKMNDVREKLGLIL